MRARTLPEKPENIDDFGQNEIEVLDEEQF
jgi:hypothetical protein